MAVTAHTYTKLAKSLVDKIADLDSDTLKVALFSAYTVGSTQDTAQFFVDITGVGTESSGTGYTAGGQALTSVTYTASGHVYTLTCANPVWTTSTITASYAVFYDSTPGTAGTNPLICYWDLGGAQSSTAASFTLTIAGTGILTVTGA